MQYRSNEINEYIIKDKFDDLVKLSEMKHILQVENLVRLISSNNDYSKNCPITNCVFVTGPSSSGKTTTAELLARELHKNGFRSIRVSLDDYYLSNEEICKRQGKPVGTPVSELDMETPDALNTELFKKQMNDLVSGKSIELPSYNFSNEGETCGTVINPSNDDVVIVEGIHALNPIFTEGLNFQKQFKVYISPFDNFINPEGRPLLKPCDVRFMRRCTRDIADRNMTLETELMMWPKVREGEEKYIKPMKKYADFFFNTSLQYEIPVLKYRMDKIIASSSPEVVAKLKEIFPAESLEYFESVNKFNITKDSIFNEFYKDFN